MRLFGSERLMKVFTSLGVEENEQIEHKMLSNAIEKAQEKIEFKIFSTMTRLTMSRERSSMRSVARYLTVRICVMPSTR